MIPPFRYYLFDVDGTLLDSASDICAAVSEVLGRTPLAGFSQETLRSYIGYHLFELFRDLLPSHTQEEFEEMLRQYREIYLGRGHQLTSVYPGVSEALAGLSGLKSTATTKSTPTTRAILEQFGLLPHFHHVQGTDGFPSKPAPDVLRRSLEALGGSPEECLFVGDSAADMEAGRRAGVKTCAVLYGYGSRDDLARWEPDYWISDLRELLPVEASVTL